MYLKLGETRLLVGQYGEEKTEKLELNFEYLFDSHSSYRRFARAIADVDGKAIDIKIKSQFNLPSDCAKLAKLLVGVQNLVTQDNLSFLTSILKANSAITPEDFINKQTALLEYFT